MFHVNEGVGDTSYANNSFLQRKIMSMAWPVTEEAITNLCAQNFPRTLSMADLGCSSGPNTLIIVSNVVKQVEEIRQKLHKKPLEYQILLNDLHGNDFNGVFRSLPSLMQSLKTQINGDFGSCFFNGVPGSFYHRLFPAQSVHFFHSSSSLHWLSQCRAQELVNGGHMVLTMLGRTSEDPCTKECASYYLDLLTSALNSMVDEGLVEKEKVESFNIPLYIASKREVEVEVLKEGSLRINHVKVLKIDWNLCDAELDSSFISYIDNNNGVHDFAK